MFHGAVSTVCGAGHFEGRSSTCNILHNTTLYGMIRHCAFHMIATVHSYTTEDSNVRAMKPFDRPDESYVSSISFSSQNKVLPNSKRSPTLVKGVSVHHILGETNSPSRNG